MRLDDGFVTRQPLRYELLNAELEVELELCVHIRSSEVLAADRDAKRASNSRANLEAHFPQSLYPESGGRMCEGPGGVKSPRARPLGGRRPIQAARCGTLGGLARTTPAWLC